MLVRVLVFSLSLLMLGAFWSLQFGLGRKLLWPTIEACLLDHQALNAAAPCVAVETEHGIESGYVLLRSPPDSSHIILAPTVHIIGIEAPALRRPNAPNYVAAAWADRHFAFPSGLPDLPDNAVALAINSQQGRTQDQLHIHIDCLLPRVKNRLAAAAPLREHEQWSQIKFVDGEAPYWAEGLGDSLNGVNVVDLAASHLGLTATQMPRLTLAVVALGEDPQHPDFVLLTRKDNGKQHAELLLDHDCDDYRRRVRSNGVR